jgi:putative endonuclease
MRSVNRHSGARVKRASFDVQLHIRESISPGAHGLLRLSALASDKYGTLYVGVTNDIVRRVYEHKSRFVAGFTKRYTVDKLVWFEIYEDATTAITREKELKKWRRVWKIRLIEETNPQWTDLYPSIATGHLG